MSLLFSSTLCVCVCLLTHTHMQRAQCVHSGRLSASATVAALLSVGWTLQNSVQTAPLAVSVSLDSTSLEISVCPRIAALP